MQHALLVVANREQFPEPVFPLGSLYVAGALEAAGARARVFDAGLHRRPLAALRAELAAFRPAVVGLSLRNADNAAYPCTRTYTGWYERLAREVAAHAPGARLVAGGPGFSIFPTELLRLLAADAGVIGDGEVAAVVLSGRAGTAGDAGLPICAASSPARVPTPRSACRPRAAARTTASTAPTRGSKVPACGGAHRKPSSTR